MEEVNLFRERKTGSSKGCGFVTMQTREQALKAIEAMELEPAVCVGCKGYSARGCARECDSCGCSKAPVNCDHHSAIAM